MSPYIIRLIVIATSTVLMQMHSIDFWASKVGPIGIAWSLALECVMIWYWWRNLKVMAIAASLLLLFGPIHEITSPALEQIKAHATNSQSIKDGKAEISRLSLALDTYNKNSQDRIGWLTKINKIQNRIDSTTARLQKLRSATSPFDLWQSISIIATQTATLLIVMIAQIISISDHRKSIEAQKKAAQQQQLSAERIEIAKNRKIAISKSTNPATPKLQPSTLLDQLIEKIPQAIEIATKDISQADWCQANGITEKHLSLAKNHRAKVEQNKEIAPLKALEKIIHALGITGDGNE